MLLLMLLVLLPKLAGCLFLVSCFLFLVARFWLLVACFLFEAASYSAFFSFGRRVGFEGSFTKKFSWNSFSLSSPHKQQGTRNQQQETNNQKPETRNKKQETRNPCKVALAALLALAACSPLRLLRPGQRLLARVELTGTSLPTADREALLALARQKANTRFPLPKLAIYQLGYSFYDSAAIKAKMQRIRQRFAAKMTAAGTDSARLGQLLTVRERRITRKQLALDRGNAVMRLGEAPVIYDSALTRVSTEQMATYLHTHGYFRGRATGTDTARYRRGLVAGFFKKLDPGRSDSADRAKFYRRATVQYRIAEGRAFTYSQLNTQIPDSAVAQVVAAGQSASPLHVGDRYNEDLIGQERSRLEALLKNQGYYDFRQAYVTLEADTSFAPFTVRLNTLIANPGPGQRHRVYRLRQVRMITDANAQRVLAVAAADTLRRAGGPLPPGAAQRPVRTDTLTLDSVRFAAFRQAYSPRILVRKVLLRPGQLFSQARTQRTQRQLADLDMFRFNTVNYRKVVLDSLTALAAPTDLLDAVINASPAKKYQETTEFGGTYVANLPGPFVNVRLKSRNPFGGAEVLELGVRAGIEGQFDRVGTTGFGTGDNIYTVQFGATAALVLPQFLVPFRVNRFFADYNPRTRFSLASTYVQRPQYTRTNVEFSYDYIWQPTAFHQYVFSPVVMNVVNPTNIRPDYQQRLNELQAEGSPLFRSFQSLYVPSVSFVSLYNSNDFNQTRNARFLRVQVEVGGLSRGLYRNADWFRLNVYNFARLSVDYRRYYKLSPQTYFVYRLNGGVAHALTRTEGTYTMPYDRYFFAGGASSIRAWKPRRLGTGGHTTTLPNGERDYISEQPGELLLEGSFEYRFPVYSFVKGAVFTDFGNVWALSRDVGVEREGARFDPATFGRQIAVGSGLGLRFDFTFLIIRLDAAAKIYDPTAPPAEQWAIRRLGRDSEHNPTFNLGIGYPF